MSCLAENGAFREKYKDIRERAEFPALSCKFIIRNKNKFALTPAGTLNMCLRYWPRSRNPYEVHRTPLFHAFF
jgi:hypothetical protein